jgi:hypothetical protein
MPRTMDTKVQWLQCACCGASSRGRQWSNRDTGFGVCEACADRCEKRYGTAEMESLYGQRGVNHSLPPRVSL